MDLGPRHMIEEHKSIWNSYTRIHAKLHEWHTTLSFHKFRKR